MPYTIIEWDSAARAQIERNATPAEVAEIEARQAASSPTVPDSVTMVRARLALNAAGMLAAATQYVANMVGVDGDNARIYWEFSATVERNHPLVLGFAAASGVTSAQLDALFISAAK